MRGLLLHAHTRIYFSDEAEANAQCPVLALVPPERRQTLIAEKRESHYAFDIHMQGARETVFFDL
jgi:protocatechuate 3,4-dioxygenase alpha subunit